MRGKTPLPTGVKAKYDKCDLQPTPRPARLAAEAAVAVLLAHEMGTRVGQTYMDGE